MKIFLLEEEEQTLKKKLKDLKEIIFNYNYNYKYKEKTLKKCN